MIGWIHMRSIASKMLAGNIYAVGTVDGSRHLTGVDGFVVTVEKNRFLGAGNGFAPGIKRVGVRKTDDQARRLADRWMR